MIVKIKDGSLEEIFVGSKVTLDPSVATPNGPFPVLTIDIVNTQYTVDDGGGNLAGVALGPDILIDVDNSAIPEQSFDFGGGTQALLFPKAYQLVNDLQKSEQILSQQVKDLQSGAAIQPLMDQIAQLTADNLRLKDKVTKALGVFPIGVGDTLNNLQTILQS